jgi:hypothetical protein
LNENHLALVLVDSEVNLRDINPLSPLNGAPTQAPRDEAIATVREGLNIEVAKQSNLMSISYRSHDSALTAQTLEQIIETSYEMRLAIHPRLLDPRSTPWPNLGPNLHLVAQRISRSIKTSAA